MKAVFFDTSGTNINIIIFDETKILFSKIISDQRNKAESLVLEIKTALENINLNINEIDYFISINGPGSFTGIRVSITVAKIINLSIKRKIILLDNLEILANFALYKLNLSKLDLKQDFNIIYNLQSDEFCTAKYQIINNFPNRISDFRKISKEELLSELAKTPKEQIVISNSKDLGILTNNYFELEVEFDTIFISKVCELVNKKITDGYSDEIEVDKIEALYIKNPKLN